MCFQSEGRSPGEAKGPQSARGKRRHISSRAGIFIILLCATILLPGCFDYTLKVGYLGIHRKILLRDKPEELKKLDQGQLRASPGPGAAITQVLERGTVLEPVKYANNWYYVKTPEGRYGWIYQSQVYRVPVYEAIYDLQYRSSDNHALALTLPMIIILLCFLFFINNAFTRTVLLPVLLLLALISAAYFVGQERAILHRHSHAFKRISSYLADKPATVYATDYIWTTRLNFWTGFTRHFSYYPSRKDPDYNNVSRIRTLRGSTNYRALRGVYVVVDTRYFAQAATQWALPDFTATGAYPGNWRKVMQSGTATLFFAQ